jgi:hypothetical protein
MCFRKSKTKTDNEISQLIVNGASLEWVLLHGSVLKELKDENLKLINFLKKHAHIQKMLQYIVNVSPTTDVDYRYKIPYVVCEIFCSLIKPINDILFTNDMRLLLFSFFENKNFVGNNMIPSDVAANVAKIVMMHIVKDLKSVYICFFLT